MTKTTKVNLKNAYFKPHSKFKFSQFILVKTSSKPKKRYKIVLLSKSSILPNGIKDNFEQFNINIVKP